MNDSASLCMIIRTQWIVIKVDYKRQCMEYSSLEIKRWCFQFLVAIQLIADTPIHSRKHIAGLDLNSGIYVMMIIIVIERLLSI